MPVQLIDVEDVAGMVRAQLGMRPEEPLGADAEFAEIGLASLDVTEIFFALENHVGMELDPVPASGVKTIGGLVDAINEQVRSANPELASTP